MIKLLMKYLLFAGVMAVVGCTEEKMEEVFIEQPNSFHIKVEGDEAFALNIPSGGKIGINGKEDRKSTRLNSSHIQKSRMPSSA